MSYAVLPKFPGATFSVMKTPTWKTLTQQATSGKEVRIALWTMPIWDFTLKYDFLLANQPYTAAGQVPQSALSANPFIANDMFGLAGFYLAQQGQYNAWLFDDPTDDAIVQGYLGTAATTGTNQTFQAVRQIGAFSEIIQNLNGTPVDCGMWQAGTPYSSTTNILPSLTGMKVQQGRTQLFWQTPGWPNYFTSGGGTSGTVEPNWRNAPYAGATLRDGSITWTNQGVPTVVYTGSNVSSLTPLATADYTINSTGLITITSSLASGQQVYLTSGFYFLCRFGADSQEFENFMDKFWRTKALKFSSIKL